MVTEDIRMDHTIEVTMEKDKFVIKSDLDMIPKDVAQRMLNIVADTLVHENCAKMANKINDSVFEDLKSCNRERVLWKAVSFGSLILMILLILWKGF